MGQLEGAWQRDSIPWVLVSSPGDPGFTALKTKRGLANIGRKRKVGYLRHGPIRGEWQEGSDMAGICQLIGRTVIHGSEDQRGGAF